MDTIEDFSMSKSHFDRDWRLSSISDDPFQSSTSPRRFQASLNNRPSSEISPWLTSVVELNLAVHLYPHHLLDNGRSPRRALFLEAIHQPSLYQSDSLSGFRNSSPLLFTAPLFLNPGRKILFELGRKTPKSKPLKTRMR